jgi:hypothetical protein
MKLTKEQAKMVIEFYAVQAAQEAPVNDTVWTEWDKHTWVTNYQTSLAIERRLNEHDWATLVNAALDYQSFDRDPAGYLYERGEDDTYKTRTTMRWTLQDVLSASIDTAFNTSKAA